MMPPVFAKNRIYFPLAGQVVYLVAVTVAAACFLATPSPSWPNCHCFRDRDFDSSRPASADPYLLATARNSLVAAASEVTKRSVVKLRMTGASETDLWLSLYMESTWGREDALSPAFVAAERTKDREIMASSLAEGTLKRVFRVDQGTITELRTAGADTAEITLSLLVSSRSRATALEVFTDVNRGRTTWGRTLNSLGIALGTTGDLIVAQVKKVRNK